MVTSPMTTRDPMTS